MWSCLYKVKMQTLWCSHVKVLSVTYLLISAPKVWTNCVWAQILGKKKCMIWLTSRKRRVKPASGYARSMLPKSLASIRLCCSSTVGVSSWLWHVAHVPNFFKSVRATKPAMYAYFWIDILDWFGLNSNPLGISGCSFVGKNSCTSVRISFREFSPSVSSSSQMALAECLLPKLFMISARKVVEVWSLLSPQFYCTLQKKFPEGPN